MYINEPDVQLPCGHRGWSWYGWKSDGRGGHELQLSLESHVEKRCSTCGAVQTTKPAPEPLYPCSNCGVLRTKAEGGTVFTVCDACWDAMAAVRAKLTKQPQVSIGAKLLSATREQLIEEVLRLRGELAACRQRKASR